MLLTLVALLTNQNTVADPYKIKVLTLNVWGLPGFIVQDAGKRFDAIRNYIEENNFDFVFFQEAFSTSARINLRTPALPYYVNGPRPHGRILGSGLRILSKYKILRTASLGYADCKKDDCLAHKGAIFIVVELPNGTKLNLVTTHLNARGDNLVRQKQIEQLKLFINYYREPNAPLLLAGDFNFGPNALPYQFILDHLDVSDAWVSTHGAEDGFTYNTVTNAYANDYSGRHGSGFEQNRIDFMFPTSGLTAILSERLFMNAPFVSDHFGLMTEFEVQ